VASVTASGPQQSPSDLSAEQFRQIDGADRVPFLPFAMVVTVGPGQFPEEPAHVLIEWTPNAVQQPTPGSALWRAAIERELSREKRDEFGEDLLAEQLRASLDRYPMMETWWAWVRAGWTAPPKPARRARRSHPLRWLRRR
jgi:hypothetical protein